MNVNAVGWRAVSLLRAAAELLDQAGRRPPSRCPRPTEEDRVAEKYNGEAYCVKCKEKRQFEGDVVVNDKGTKMAKGKCPVCGTTLNRILGKA
ncbi:MAG: hypothetical protein IRZ02_00415 [Acidothermus sp.]|nr:hypothetical protein [Acidothermus sp.]